MVVHDVEVDDVRAGLQDIVNLLTQLGEVSGQDGGGDQEILVSPHVQSGRSPGGFVLRVGVRDTLSDVTTEIPEASGANSSNSQR